MTLKTKFRVMIVVSVAGLLAVAAFWIRDQHSSLLFEKSQKAKNLVEVPYSVVERQYQLEKDGKISRAEAQRQAKRDVAQHERSGARQRRNQQQYRESGAGSAGYDAWSGDIRKASQNMVQTSAELCRLIAQFKVGRRDPRIEVALPVQLTGTDAQGRALSIKK